MRKSQSYIHFFIALSFLLSSCSSIKYLEKKNKIGKQEYLLYKQDVKGYKSISKEKFTSLYQQKPNRKLPLVGSRPYFYFYIIGSSLEFKNKLQEEMVEVTKKYDAKIAQDSTNPKKVKKWIVKKEKKLERLRIKLKEGNGFMRTFGEAPSIAKKDILERTATMMSQMLKAKGYFHNKVIPEYDTSGKRLTIVYRIEEGEPHKIGSIKYTINNNKVLNLSNELKQQSLLKENKVLDENDLVEERDRIDKHMKNRGFYDFDKQFVFARVDTNNIPYKADVEIILDTASEKNIYKKYKIQSIYCVIDLSRNRTQLKDTVPYNNITFIQTHNKFGKKVLAGKIKLRPGNYYSLENTISTQLNLTNLDNFRYIDIRYHKLQKEDSVLNVEIVLNSNKKFQITDEWGLNVTQGLPGPQGSITFLNRNILRGCENFDASVRYGIEGVASASDPNVVYRSVEAAVDMGITFPQFYIPTRLRFKFNNYYPRTRLNFGYYNLVRPEYSRKNFKLAVNYTLTRNTYSRYIFSLADLNIVTTTKRTSFEQYLDTLAKQGSTLPVSFQPAFVSSIHFTYLFNNNDFTRFVNGTFLRLFAETGGTTFHLLENEFKRDGIISDNKLLGQLSYFKFLKFNVDYRKYHSVLPKSQVAFRVNAGFAYPFDEALPYEKYFFAGGSNSIRAWRPRRLGPGSRAPVLNPDGTFDYKFEQPGEIVLETSLESRFKIIKYLEGAVFIDAGNVWRFSSNNLSNTPENFKTTRFIKEIAVGTGFGIRLNFTFIIVRFDLGLKVYDPAFPENERFVARKWSMRTVFGTNELGILNLGIGYPF